MLNIAVLISGNGTNLQALIDAEKSGKLTFGKITLVVSSNKDACGLTRALKHGIKTEVVEKKTCVNDDEFDKLVLTKLLENNIDIVVLAGFLPILGQQVINQFERRIINIHPSLIPSFCGPGFYGLKVHQAALKKGVKITGATVHFVNEIPDDGEIIMQKAVPVLDGDTPETLQKRVMEEAEWKILPEAVELICKEYSQKDNRIEIKTLPEILKNNSYPGRGIVIGITPDSKHAVIAYFIMGRSINSRNRVFVEDGEGIRTEAHDPSKMTDPSLIIYSPVQVLGDYTIVTNGDQTDTIYDYINAGKTFEQALNTRSFEPDEPNFTPRISGLLNRNERNYKLSILKSNNGNPKSTLRFYFNYQNPLPGQGHFIHTYKKDGSPLPSFEGEPIAVLIDNDIDVFTCEIWDSLDFENKVSLFVRYINLSSGEYITRIINKNA
ncbi:MAG: phosphoribosylglycinamide formyltransferase [Clostridiales bacterium]|nr:phosphoribosylglycinamide formyltransferase [Clostridiales bacterium]